jgi:long-chain acyl-CoA synthetase
MLAGVPAAAGRAVSRRTAAAGTKNEYQERTTALEPRSSGQKGDRMTMPGLADRLWLPEYLAGVPADANVAAYASLADLVESRCARYRDACAFESMGGRLSYRELAARSAELAAFLGQVRGLPREARVALLLPNVLQYPVALFGVLRAGLTAVNLDPALDPETLRQRLVDSGASAVVALENYCAALAAVLPGTAVQLVITTEIGDLVPAADRVVANFVARHVKKSVPKWQLDNAVALRDALAQGAAAPPRPPPAVGSADLALLHYTAGTTGPARAVMLSHGNLVANAIQFQATLAPRFAEDVETVVTVLPLHDLFGLTLSCLGFLTLGARNLLIHDSADAAAVVRAIDTSRSTALFGNSVLFAALLDQPGLSDIDFDRLKLAMTAGDGTPQALAENWQLATGTPLLQAYGLAEAAPLVCCQPLHQAVWDGSVGVPLPSTHVELRDAEGLPCPPGKPGELHVRGPQLMRGYWGQPQATAVAFSADGWLRSGDLAVMGDSGRVTLLTRCSDVIRAGSREVVPDEIENVVALHPQVRAVACVGDLEGGLKLAVVPASLTLTEDGLREFCRRNLGLHKLIRSIEFRDELPRSARGGVLRRALR